MHDQCCSICFDSCQELRGCACRGSASYAHKECLAQAAAANMLRSQDISALVKCDLCKQMFPPNLICDISKFISASSSFEKFHIPHQMQICLLYANSLIELGNVQSSFKILHNLDVMSSTSKFIDDSFRLCMKRRLQLWLYYSLLPILQHWQRRPDLALAVDEVAILNTALVQRTCILR